MCGMVISKPYHRLLQCLKVIIGGFEWTVEFRLRLLQVYCVLRSHCRSTKNQVLVHDQRTRLSLKIKLCAVLVHVLRERFKTISINFNALDSFHNCGILSSLYFTQCYLLLRTDSIDAIGYGSTCWLDPDPSPNLSLEFRAFFSLYTGLEGKLLLEHLRKIVSFLDSSIDFE